MIEVILVDQNDNQIWIMEKMKAHEEGLLHRAFSIYVVNDKQQVLLQQRALHKYHSPGIYANTCCSHQFPQEDSLVAAHRRLWEEMWFDVDLQKLTEFIYNTPVPTNLIEHEYLHVYIGKYDWQNIVSNPEEVAEYKRVTYAELDTMVQNNDKQLAPWTQITWQKIRTML